MNDTGLNFLYFVLGAMTIFFLDHIFEPKHITIESSSDSEWVKSDKDYPDTTVINVWINKHEGKTDTIFSTTYYKRIEL